MRKLTCLILFLSIPFIPAAWGQSADNRAHPWDTTERTDPSVVLGEWQVIGWNPGSAEGPADYRGVVQVERTDETYRVVWRIGSQQFIGNGILRGPMFFVAYNGGLATYIIRSEGMDGIWATTEGTRLGREGWTR
jgi:hypothetical protein